MDVIIKWGRRRGDVRKKKINPSHLHIFLLIGLPTGT